MQVSRMVAGTKLGYSYQLSLDAIETLGDTLSNLSQITFAWAFVHFPEYLDPDAAQRLALLLSSRYSIKKGKVDWCATPDENRCLSSVYAIAV
ncbi:hypothetical protein ACQ4M3_38970 [Leptolyngbya sp. AN03gr2]|uniref:hypothetical protein n=1 Tax=unclassified Leptolyngbya TaxID=2650499 RepID=UPI003D3210F8